MIGWKIKMISSKKLRIYLNKRQISLKVVKIIKVKTKLRPI
jgi:hypothetical protein